MEKIIELAKKQIMYAIYKCMEVHGIDECDFHHYKEKPRFIEDGVGYEIHFIDQPNLDNMTMQITVRPSYGVMLLPRDFKPSDFRHLKTLENIFNAIYNHIVFNDNGFNGGLYTIENREEWLNTWSEEYSETT